MIRIHGRSFLTTLLISILVMAFSHEARAASECDRPGISTIASRDQPDPPYNGRKLSYWLESIRDSNGDVPLAFDAIRALGPLAWPAVPVLDAIVGQPFKPVKAGEDKTDVILAKLQEIQLRADAIDGLSAIGPAAACSTKTLIRWALTVRVVPANPGITRTSNAFPELVGIDVLERMRVAGAVPQLGQEALTTAATLLTAHDVEKRKFGVAILAERTLPIVVSLLKSSACDDRKLGLAILADMWPVVPAVHLLEFRDVVACDTN